MPRIALTGGIGGGKSTVAARFAELGATIIDADAIAREVVMAGTSGLAALVERFGPGILTADGVLDRPKLAKIVFGDDAALADLNGIVHPRIRERMTELLAQVATDGVVVHDIPLLVEGDLTEAAYDAVVVVETPMELRLERLERRGLAREDALSRMAHQASDAERAAIATVVLDNGGSLESLHAQVDAAWQQIVGPPPGDEPEAQPAA
jgi:dephospho-CoA kinase